jgi:hypothetical protein
VLELLKDGVRHPSGENVTWEQQDREPVNRRECRTSDHVCGPWSYRRGAGQSRQAVSHTGEAGRSMDHPLLVAALAVHQGPWALELRFQKSLPQPGDIAMAENAKTSLY